jgi:hypothetical protein
MRPFLLCLGLSTVLFGCGSAVDATGGTGGGAMCPSTEPEGLIVWVDGQCPALSDDLPFDGTFQTTKDGFFQVVGADATVELHTSSPSVPEGTLVRVTERCDNGTGYVMIENLPELDGTPNPTEGGSRLWYFAMSGYVEVLPPGFPFSYDEPEACTIFTQDEAGGYRTHVKDLVLSGAGFSVTVPPEQVATLTVPSGPHAGAYEAWNAAIWFRPAAPLADTASVRSFRIQRASP